MRPVIEAIDACPVEIPMDRPFLHARSSRARTASVLVAVAAAGCRGWGEGAPRSYVTGETVPTVLEALGRVDRRILAELIDFGDFTTAMRDLARCDVTRLLGVSRRMPAAAAALEIALFDLICQLHQQPGLSGLRSVPEAASLLNRRASAVPVSFVMDLTGEVAERIGQLRPESIAAIRHVKVKVTADVADSVRRVAVVREQFGSATQISVDVNGDWDRATAISAARRLAELGVAWIEEPVAPRDWEGLREIRECTGMAVMLDESCTGLADLDVAAERAAADYVNVRISKCGGIFPALALINAARERSFGAQLGVHVGEVGPLWAAARLVSCAVGSLAAVEAGRQDEWFPVPVTDPPYAVDRVNWLAEPLDGLGIGIVPTGTLLEQCAQRPESVG
jgi:L-alanine-DL-glutamate epimerase-like enolase superfamily enzyme